MRFCSFALIVLTAFAGCQPSTAPEKKLPASGTLQATGGITTIIGKNCAQGGLPFTGSTYTISGVQAPYAETTVSVGAPLLMSGGLGCVQRSNLQMFYVLSDSLDATLNFYSSSSGTGLVTSLPIVAGTPSEWDLSAGTALCPIAGNWASLQVTAGTTAGGLSSSGTATTVHVRTSLSQ